MKKESTCIQGDHKGCVSCWPSWSGYVSSVCCLSLTYYRAGWLNLGSWELSSDIQFDDKRTFHRLKERTLVIFNSVWLLLHSADTACIHHCEALTCTNLPAGSCWALYPAPVGVNTQDYKRLMIGQQTGLAAEEKLPRCIPVTLGMDKSLNLLLQIKIAPVAEDTQGTEAFKRL